MTTPSSTSSAPNSSQGLATLLETVRRRKMLAIVPLIFVLVATASLALFLPSIWRARAVVMVDRQQIPESFIRSTVTSDLESRIITLSQEILSRDRLLEIAARYGLYPRLQRTGSADEIVDAMRRDIRLDLMDERDRRPRDNRMLAFSIAYTATDPGVAAQVTNTLAGLYIAENSKLREQQATGTADFLETQLDEVRKTLGAQESRVTAFKERHLGELPEQRETNLRTLERLQQQLDLAQENQRRAAERRQMITQALAEFDLASGAAGGTAGEPPPPAASAQARLTLLRHELAQLLTKFSERYPDVVYMREQIRALEARAAEEAKLVAASPATGGDNARALRPVPQNAYVQSLMTQLDHANLELKTGGNQIANLQRQIALYQKRVEQTPKREHELALITRDYETTRELFRSLLAKRGEAGLAAELEHQRKGEHFRIMQAAGLPDRPLGPNRLRLFLVGLVLAVGAAGAAVILAENVDTSFRRVDELRARLSVPVLSTIPRITTESDQRRLARRRRLASAAVAAGLLAVIGTSYAIAHGNHQLVGMLTSDGIASGRR